MENKKDEQTIYFKDLLFAALYRWKSIFAWAVILAVLLGGFKGYSAYKEMKNADIQSNNTVQQQMEQESYEAKKASLERQLATLRENIKSQETYLQESVLMQLDPYDFYEAYISVYVDSEYQILPGMEYQNPDHTDAIINSYEAALTGETSVQAVAADMGMEPAYLLELITTEAPEDTNTLVVHAKYVDQAGAEKLLGLLVQQLESIQVNVAQTVDEHEIRIAQQYVRKALDPTLTQTQTQQEQRLSDLYNSRITVQAEKDGLVAPGTRVASGRSVVKDAIVFAVLGGVLGVFLTVCVIWVGHITTGKVYSARTLRDRTGVKVLGCMGDQKKHSAIDRWLLKKEGRCVGTGQAQAALLAVNIRNRCGDAKQLLVTGTTSPEDRAQLLQALCQAMPGIQVEDRGSIQRDAAALEALAGCNAVLLVEQCNVSQYRSVEEAAEIVCDYGKQLLGCVLLGG